MGYVLSWFLVGAITTLISHLLALRGSEYSEDYLDTTTVLYSLALVCGGFITLFIFTVLFIVGLIRVPLTKTLHSVANIGR